MKIVAIFQLLGGLLAAAFAIATGHNLFFISMRPETISVVNTIIGQGVLIIALAAMATLLIRRGLHGLKSDHSPEQASD